MINRFREWLHRDCRRDQGTAGALLAVGGRLAELSQAFRATLERPELVTVIAFGTRAAGLTGAVDIVRRVTREEGPQIAAVPVVDGPEPLIVVDSKTVRLQGLSTEAITLEAQFPIESFQVVVMADFDRVEVRGLFLRTDLIGMASPIGFGKEWRPGEQVRALVARRELRG